MSRLKTVPKKNRTTTTKVRDKIAPLTSEARGAASTAAATAGTAAVTAAGTASHAASHAAGAARQWAAPRVDTAIGQAARRERAWFRSILGRTAPASWPGKTLKWPQASLT